MSDAAQGRDNRASTTTEAMMEGVLLWNLRQLLRWLEYGEFEPTEADKEHLVAWTNALAAAIKALEKRDV